MRVLPQRGAVAVGHVRGRQSSVPAMALRSQRESWRQGTRRL